MVVSKVNWKLHTFISLFIVMINFFFEFFRVKLPFPNLIYLYSVYIVDNLFLVLALLSLVLIFSIAFGKKILKKTTMILMIYLSSFYIGGFLGSLSWLVITGTEL